MTCPICHAKECRRSRRRSMLDYVFSITGAVPWRCEACETRFHARMIPLHHLIHAHCTICGNLELKRISPEHVPGAIAFLGRLLNVPALRCEPCRHKFFSVLPMGREEEQGRVAPTTTH